ncbi:DUF7713 domain-containing protein [Streptomyces sp. NPDC003006]
MPRRGVGGRTLSWHELVEALFSFEGFRFRLIDDCPFTAERSEAAKTALGVHDTSS